jgi:hypothetical protein
MLMAAMLMQFQLGPTGGTVPTILADHGDHLTGALELRGDTHITTTIGEWIMVGITLMVTIITHHIIHTIIIRIIHPITMVVAIMEVAIQIHQTVPIIRV